MAHTDSQGKDYLKELLECETRIIGILKQLEEVEKTKGIDSPEFKSMCGLFQDFLADEERLVSMVIKDHAVYGYVLYEMRRKEILKVDEALYAMNFTLDNSVLYRMYRLLLERNPESGEFDPDFAIKDNIDETIAIEALKECKDLGLKYRLAFINPRFCIDMAQSEFHSELLSPEVETALLSEKAQYQFMRMTYLRKRFSEIIGFIATSKGTHDDECYRFLLPIKKGIPECFIDLELELLVNSGIPFFDVNEAYSGLVCIEEAEKQRKHLTTE